MVGQGCVSVAFLAGLGGGLYARRISPPLSLEQGTNHIRKTTLCSSNIAPLFVSFRLIFFRSLSGLTRTRSFKPEAPPRNNRLVSERIPGLTVGLCRPSLPSLCSYVPACRKAVFHRLPVRRVPGRSPNLRGVVRQTGRQQGWKSGCIRVESRSGCDGHQIWERSSPGGSEKEVAGFKGPCLNQILWKCV